MRFSRSFVALGLVLACQGLMAQPSAERPSTIERDKVFEQASRVAVTGPASIELLGKATLELAQDYVFVGPPHAFQVLHSLDPTAVASEVLGLVFPKDHGQHWLVSVDLPDPKGSAYDARHVQVATAEGQGLDALQSSGWIHDSTIETRNPIIALLQGNHGIDRPFVLSLTATAQGSEVGQLHAQKLADAFAYRHMDALERGNLLLKKYWVALAALLLALSWWVQARLTRSTT
ncbi:hypothetical protein J4P02_15850 [Pseudomonas sp. NFXW11]|uniref:hypothetical protein n=1 Tax=Pseudomonas sp. NFXW11 TaxID=2819531 RepID=UPI003CE686B1